MHLAQYKRRPSTLRNVKRTKEERLRAAARTGTVGEKGRGQRKEYTFFFSSSSHGKSQEARNVVTIKYGVR